MRGARDSEAEGYSCVMYPSAIMQMCRCAGIVQEDEAEVQSASFHSVALDLRMDPTVHAARALGMPPATTGPNSFFN